MQAQDDPLGLSDPTMIRRNPFNTGSTTTTGTDGQITYPTLMKPTVRSPDDGGGVVSVGDPQQPTPSSPSPTIGSASPSPTAFGSPLTGAFPAANANAATFGDIGKAAASKDWQKFFGLVTQGLSGFANPLNDPRVKNTLTSFGFNITPPSAAGQVSKIQTPDGNWIRVVNGDTNSKDWSWGWIPQGSGSGAADTTSTGTSSNDIYSNAILSRLAQLGAPVNDPMRDLLTLSALGRANDLATNPPYTDSEEAALVARDMNPLTEARDAALQRNVENASARGFLPSSGILAGMDRGTEADYEKNVAAAGNARAVSAVNLAQQRKDQALSILGQVEQLAASGRAEDRQRAVDMINTAALLPQFDEARLNELLSASGEGPTSPSTALNQLFGLNTQSLNSSAVTSAAWGQFLGSLLNNPKWQSLLGVA